MFTRYVPFLFLATYVLSIYTPGSRIQNGTNAEIAKYPYQVSIQYLGHHRCGGAIISDIHVVTAAHCVHRISYRQLAVLLGVDDLSKPEEGRLIDVHSMEELNYPFDPDNLDYDVIFLRLQEWIEVTPNIQPIKFYDELNFPEPEVGELLTVTGWGTTNTGWGSTTLQVTTLPVVKRDICTNKYGHDEITPRMFCVEGGASQGDAGAPAADKHGRLVGIFSWPNGCKSGYPGVYINLGMFRNYIKENLKV